MTAVLAADAAGLAKAAGLLREGKLVSFGTETVYGLGADATNGLAVAAIFAAKGRPRFNPLICHYPAMAMAFADTVADARAELLGAAFWPGPLTLVLPRGPGCAADPLVSAGLSSLAVRVPAGAAARELLRLAGRAVAAPSANRSGAISPTSAADVLAELGGRIAAVVDSGACAVGLESTVVDLTGGQAVLLRPGGVPREAIEAVIGAVALAGEGSAIRAPGMLASHYAPRLPLRLDARTVAGDEALLAFGTPLPGAAIGWNLSESGDLAEAASRLFGGLRYLDAEGARRGLRGIAAMRVPETGLGTAIGDRLHRAAAPRPTETS